MKRSDIEKEVLWFSRKVFFFLFIKYLFIQSTLWFFCWGAVVLLTRSTWGIDSGLLLYGAYGLVPITAIAGLLARRGVPPAQAVLAMIDRQSHAGGLIMAQGEVRSDDWQTQSQLNQSPGLRWRGNKWTGLLLSSLAFLWISFLVPQKFIERTYAQRLEVGRQIEQIQSQMEVLEQEQALSREQATSLKEQLEQVESQAQGNDPVKTWESLDSMQEKLRQVAQQQQQNALSQIQQLARTQTLNQALRDSLQQLDQPLKDQAMKALSSMLAEAMKDSTALVERLDPELIQTMAEFLKENRLALDDLNPQVLQMLKDLPALQLSPEQLQKLAENLQVVKGQNLESLKKLAESGLLDKTSLKQCQSAGNCNPEALREFLQRFGQDGQGPAIPAIVQAAGQCTGDSPGWGINRGRGDAELTWKLPSNEERTAFTEQTLPQASLENIKNSTVQGVRSSAPEIDLEAASDRKSVLDGAAAGGGSADAVTIHPRHRRTVGNYFDRLRE